MKIELKGKAKIITVIAVFVIALAVGMLLEHFRNNKFSVETIADIETVATTQGAVVSGEVIQSENGEKEMTTCSPEPVSKSDMLSEGKININIADAETLMLINGIGESLAKRIIDYRTEHGPFEAIEEIENVNGIGEKKFENMRDMICVE